MADSESGATRRNVLKAAGVTVAAGIGGGALLDTGVAASTEWSEAEHDIEAALNDVVYTADGPYAVGEGGVVATRNGGEWEVVVESGPSATNNPLTAVDVSHDGERIYFCGGSGALGAYDVNDGVKYDYSAPNEKTSTWEAIAVSGDTGTENVIVANGSGETYDGDYDADRAESDGGECMEWGEVVKPAGGSTIPGVAVAEDDPGLWYGVDTSQEAFRSEDHNGSWEGIGIANAGEAFNDVAGTSETVFVAAGGGLVYRLDCDCNNWTPIDVGSRSLNAIDRRQTDADVDGAMAAAAEGYVYERVESGWEELETPVGVDLQGVAYATDRFDTSENADVAVGGNGTIVERER